MYIYKSCQMTRLSFSVVSVYFQLFQVFIDSINFSAVFYYKACFSKIKIVNFCKNI